MTWQKFCSNRQWLCLCCQIKLLAKSLSFCLSIKFRVRGWGDSRPALYANISEREHSSTQSKQKNPCYTKSLPTTLYTCSYFLTDILTLYDCLLSTSCYLASWSNSDYFYLIQTQTQGSPCDQISHNTYKHIFFFILNWSYVNWADSAHPISNAVVKPSVSGTGIEEFSLKMLAGE